MLISCIMPTRGRPKLARNAVELFRAQTVSEKELIVIDDRDAPSFDAAPEGVTYLRMDRRLTIGAKRNIAISHAVGDVIAHWDDDDWYAPDRLSHQLDTLLSGPYLMTAFNPVPFYDGERWWLYRSSNPRYGVGASFMYHRSHWREYPFADVNLDEDNQFIFAARDKVIITSGERYMYAGVHPGNTSPRKLDGAMYTPMEPICA